MDDAELRALLAAQARLITELSERIAPVRPTLTVEELYKTYAKVERKASTQKAYQGRLQPFVAALGTWEVMALRQADWSAYRAQRAAEVIGPEKDRHKRKSSTLNLELGVVKAMLSWAVDQEMIPSDPLARAKRVKTRKHRETAPKPPAIDDLIAKVDGPQLVVVLCAVDAGLRCSEIASLSWDWIDRRAMTIALPNWACKGDRGGVVPMTMRLRDAIDTIPRSIRWPWVLASNRGPDGRYNRRTLSRWWRSAADAAGLQAAPGDGNVHLHDGRHAAASNAVAAGVPIEVVSKSLLRHSSIGQTLDYLQLPPPDLDMARALIEDGIKGSSRRR